MATFDHVDRLLDSVSAPFGAIVTSIGTSVAEAQRALDLQAIENFLRIYGEGETALEELKRIGYQPTWYHLPETTAELKLALTISGESNGAQSSRPSTPAALPAMQLYGAPVDGGYSGKYNYDIRAAATITFRIVPIPPPAAAAGMAVAPNLVAPATTVAQARELLSELGIEYELEGPGETVQENAVISEQVPLAGEIVPGGISMTLQVRAVAPDFINSETTVANARAAASAFGINLTVVPGAGAATTDESIVTGQNPAPGELLPESGEMSITV